MGELLKPLDLKVEECFIRRIDIFAAGQDGEPVPLHSFYRGFNNESIQE